MALMQESHRLAFHDELTGLPGRRALKELRESVSGYRMRVHSEARPRDS